MSADPTATSQGLVGSKNRRDHRNHPDLVQDHKKESAPGQTKAPNKAEASINLEARNAHSKRFRDERDIVATKNLQKRDTGTRLVRQVRENLGGLTGEKYPSDLAVMSWAPGVQSIAAGRVDYIFEETKGEDTLVYIIDSGVAVNYLVKTDTKLNLLVIARFD